MKTYKEGMKITLKGAISNIVEHYYETEKKHFKEYDGNDTEKHIFPYILALKGYLKSGYIDE